MAAPEAVTALYELAQETVALFGFLCILLNIALPLLGFVLRFVLVEAPVEWRKWQLHRTQQRELRLLQRRIDSLARRKAAEEQEARRRARMSSARKKQPAESARKAPASNESCHPITKFTRVDTREGSGVADGRRPAVDTELQAVQHKQQSTRPHRHRLSIYSTVKKKPAASARRDHQDARS